MPAHLVSLLAVKRFWFTHMALAGSSALIASCRLAGKMAAVCCTPQTAPLMSHRGHIFAYRRFLAGNSIHEEESIIPPRLLSHPGTSTACCNAQTARHRLYLREAAVLSSAYTMQAQPNHLQRTLQRHANLTLAMDCTTVPVPAKGTATLRAGGLRNGTAISACQLHLPSDSLH